MPKAFAALQNDNVLKFHHLLLFFYIWKDIERNNEEEQENHLTATRTNKF